MASPSLSDADPPAPPSPGSELFLAAAEMMASTTGITVDAALAQPGFVEFAAAFVDLSPAAGSQAAESDVDGTSPYAHRSPPPTPPPPPGARRSRMPLPQQQHHRRFERGRSVAPGSDDDGGRDGSDDGDEEEDGRTELGSDECEPGWEDEMRAQDAGLDAYEDDDELRALDGREEVDDDDDDEMMLVDPALSALHAEHGSRPAYYDIEDDDGDDLDALDALVDDALSEPTDDRQLAHPRALLPSGTASSLLAAGSSAGTPTAAGRSDHQQQQLRQEFEQRQRVNARRPVASHKGKFWRPAELPPDLLQSILRLAVTDLIQLWMDQTPRRTRDMFTVHRYSVASLLAYARARVDVVRWRLVCKSWKQATDALVFWKHFLMQTWGSNHAEFRQPLTPRSPVFHNVWAWCWACVVAPSPTGPFRASVRVTSVCGATFLCALHGERGKHCGRCLAPAASLGRDAAIVIGDTVGENLVYGALVDGRSSACTFCRREVLCDELVAFHQPPVASARDGGARPYGRYVDDGELTVGQAASRVVEARWLAAYTPFDEFYAHFQHQRALDRPPRVVRGKEDKHAMWLAMKDLASAAGDDTASFATLQAFEELADDFEDEEDDDEDDDEDAPLADAEAAQVVALAVEASSRERLVGGYWVSPDEHAQAYHAGLARLPRLPPTAAPPSTHSINAYLFRPLPVRQPPVRKPLDAPQTDPVLPPPKTWTIPPPALPLGASLARELVDAYVPALHSVLRPALDALVHGLSGLSDGGALAAATLPLPVVLDFCRTALAWERGAPALLRLSFADAERQGIAPVDFLVQLIGAASPPSRPPPARAHPASQQQHHPAVVVPPPPSSAAHAHQPDSPLIGPVLPPSHPAASAGAPPSPRSTGTSAAGLDHRSHSPSSHSSRPSLARSTPPTSTSPSPPTPTADEPVGAKPTDAPSPAGPTTSPADPPAARPRRRLQSADPRLVVPSTAVPSIPVSFDALGPETVRALAAVWFAAWQPLTLCACTICRRATGRDAVGLSTTAAAAAPGDDNGNGTGTNNNGKRKEEGAGARADEGQQREGEGETSPVPAKKARVDSTTTAAPVDGGA